MTLPVFIGAGIVVVASVAFVVIGTVYKWDMASLGYARWIRVTGAVAVVSLAGVAAWTRMEAPVLAIAIMLGGVVLAVAYVVLHRRLTASVQAVLQSRDDAR